MSCAHAVRRVGAAFTSTARMTPVESPVAALRRGRSKLMRQYPGRGRPEFPDACPALSPRRGNAARVPRRGLDALRFPVVSDPRAGSVAALTASEADSARISYLPKHTL